VITKGGGSLDFCVNGNTGISLKKYYERKGGTTKNWKNELRTALNRFWLSDKRVMGEGSLPHITTKHITVNPTWKTGKRPHSEHPWDRCCKRIVRGILRVCLPVT